MLLCLKFLISSVNAFEKNTPSSDPKDGQLNLFPGFLDINAGKDELNFAEFPIAALTSRVNPDVKTITYEDEITDAKSGKLMTRKLKIAGSDFYGLPTSVDDEVILALLNLSRLQGFQDRTIRFSRLQIMTMLGWKDSGHYFKRIKESIERWLGVSLYYDNSWREKGAESWNSEGFHLIDGIKWGNNGEESEITWNEKIFKSFERGNLKALDLKIYRELRSPTARRIFRFLDKRFGLGKSRWSFDLSQFAYNKVGLGRDSYKDIAQVKRQLQGAIKQLEAVQFIMPCSPKERFTKVSRGVWKVHFERYHKQTSPPLPLEIEDISELEARLVDHGVGRTAARNLLNEFGDKRVTERLEWFDYRSRKNLVGGIKSVAGYLVKSIKDDDFTKPDGFQSKKEAAQEKARRAAVKRRKVEKEKKAIKAEKARQKAEEAEKQAHLALFETLDPELQEDIRTAAIGDSGWDTGVMAEIMIAGEIGERIERGELKG